MDLTNSEDVILVTIIGRTDRPLFNGRWDTFPRHTYCVLERESQLVIWDHLKSRALESVYWRLQTQKDICAAATESEGSEGN